MNRTTAREIAVHYVFELSFSGESAQALLERELTEEAFALRGAEEPLYAQFPGPGELEYITALVRGVDEKRSELDGWIGRYAKGWRLSRIDRVAVALMQVCLYEIVYMPDVPIGAAINEAVEISKKYVDEDVGKFINGILGSFVRDEMEDKIEDEPDDEPPEEQE